MALRRSGLARPIDEGSLGRPSPRHSSGSSHGREGVHGRWRSWSGRESSPGRGGGGAGVWRGEMGGAVGGGGRRKWKRRWLRRTGEGSIVTHRPHCQVNAIWVFYRRHCSHWHFQSTSHTLSLSITHSLHFLGQPPRLTLSRAAALAENSLQDGVVVAAASEVRGGDDRNWRESISPRILLILNHHFSL